MTLRPILLAVGVLNIAATIECIYNILQHDRVNFFAALLALNLFFGGLMYRLYVQQRQQDNITAYLKDAEDDREA